MQFYYSKRIVEGDIMAKTVVSCGFSQKEIETIDDLVGKGHFASRSDAIRTCTIECLVRRGLI